MRLQLLVFLLMLSFAGYSQGQLKGKVTDETGQGLPGVSVLVKGTTTGTVTDTDGVYALSSVAPDAILVFSFIGYLPQEIPVGGQTNIDAKMAPDAKTLEEVVVIGYGTSSVKELTAAVSSVNAKDIAKVNPIRIDQAMQGQMAGVNVTTASASPGGSMNIRIRGISSTGSNEPLILVDGIPYSSNEGLNALNPSDIESIDVLKDASTAIYGVRAANGVIFITTKQGRKNAKPSIEFNGYYGVQKVANKLRVLDAREFAVLKNEAFAAGGQTPPYINTNLGSGTDWQDEIFDEAPIQNYSLNMSGGSDRSTYSLGGSMLSQDGIMGGNKSTYRRYTARLNYGTDFSPKVNLQSLFLYTNEQRKTVAESGIGAVTYNALNASPLASPRRPDGNYTFLEEFSDIINPLAQIDNTFNQTNVHKVTGKEELTYKINPSFQIAGRASYNFSLINFKTFSPLAYYGSGKAQNTAANENLDPFIRQIAPGFEIAEENRVTESRTTYLDYNFEAFLTYDKTFGEHKINAVLGTSYLRYQGENLTGTAYNVPYNSNDFADVSAADGTNLFNNTSSWQYKEGMLSYFLRAKYSLRDRYLVQFIMRRDASTNFGKNNRFGYFPSILAGWIVSEESFFQSSMIQFLKIRGGYGTIGNDRIGNFRYRALLGGEGVYPFDDQLTSGVAFGVLGNQDLKWETTTNFNIGADINFWNDRISVAADYYIKTTRDLLFQPDLAGVLGAYGAGGSPPFVNGGTVRNKGFEFMIEYNQVTKSALQFNAKYNLTTIKNEVTSLPAGVAFIPGAGFGVGGGVATRMEVGYPMGYFLGYETDGIYQSEQEIAERGITQDGARPGDLRFVDQDNDGTINFSNDTDKKMIGSPIPDVIMGLTLGLDYKGFDFSTLMYASVGNEILRNYERQQPLANQLDYKINRWTGPGSTNEHPRLTTGATRNNVMSEYFLEDGSYLRVRNIQLGYTLPASLSKRIGASRVRFYVAANNLFTFTKYRGYDPDFSNGSALGSGIDNGVYPQAKVFMGGLNLNF